MCIAAFVIQPYTSFKFGTYHAKAHFKSIAPLSTSFFGCPPLIAPPPCTYMNGLLACYTQIFTEYYPVSRNVPEQAPDAVTTLVMRLKLKGLPQTYFILIS